MSVLDWSSNSHPISDVRDWSQRRRLELRPDFQRKEVWSISAKIMLMDSILSNIPMPKFYVQSEIRAEDTYRKVIDGQQRLSAIIEFLDDGFSLTHPYAGEHKGKCFSELPQDVKDRFLAYELDFNFIRNASESDVREIYSRVNKYNVALNKQELRRSDYPGHFLMASEALAQRDRLEEFRIFTVANRRRMQDVEYVSELLAALIGGPQDKKSSLDEYYENLAVWEESERHVVIGQFDAILSEICMIFPNSGWAIGKTRFRQKADFYALFIAIHELLNDGGSLKNKNIDTLLDDLKYLDEFIEPASEIKLLSEYAIKCTSQANTVASRVWRKNLLKLFLSGSYLNDYPSPEKIEKFISIMKDAEDPMCPPQEHECPHCNQPTDIFKDITLDWDTAAEVFQLCNARVIHASCGTRRAETAG